jgi:hypothetical protein
MARNEQATAATAACASVPVGVRGGCRCCDNHSRVLADSHQDSRAAAATHAHRRGCRSRSCSSRRADSTGIRSENCTILQRTRSTLTKNRMHWQVPTHQARRPRYTAAKTRKHRKPGRLQTSAFPSMTTEHMQQKAEISVESNQPCQTHDRNQQLTTTNGKIAKKMQESTRKQRKMSHGVCMLLQWTGYVRIVAHALA